MPIVHIIDAVTDWVRENVCQGIKLKAPPVDERAATDAGYEYQLVTPSAFSMFVPAKDKLPPNISPIPSVCVRFMTGTENLTDSEGTVGVQLAFSAWDPGYHSKDIFDPVNGIQNAYKQRAEADFDKNGGGWRDAWNFVDIALRKIGSAHAIGGYQIDRSIPVKFGPLQEQEAIIDYYPFWFAWLTFSVKYSALRNNPDYQKFL